MLKFLITIHNSLFYAFVILLNLSGNNQRDVTDGEWRGRTDKTGNRTRILKKLIFHILTLEK